MKRAIFIHIPRTGGTSIRKSVTDNFDSFYIPNQGNVKDDVQFTVLDHRSPGWYLRRRRIAKSRWEQSVKIAFVRNPWDRLVSLYKYLSSYRPYRRRFRVSNALLSSFDLFANEVASGTSTFVKAVSHYNVRDWSQANPQVRWLEWGVDVIGRFESLEEDWSRICKSFGIQVGSLSNKNRSKDRTDYRSFYTDELAESVGNYYAEDIARFSYEF